MNVQPVLKWVGGKTQILDKILSLFPTEINNYYEPFIGGGSILFGVLAYIKANKITIKGQIYAYDINEPLIYMYKNIQQNPTELYNKIDKLKKKYTIAKDKEKYYYKMRDVYNDLDFDRKSLDGSALFIFLNKTCFRGIYRMGPNGFNVPFGHYKTVPKMVDKDNLIEISDSIQDVNFEVSSYKDSLKSPKKGDFVYMDPPYFPETKTSFVKYYADGFSQDDHENLFKICNKLNSEEVKFVMSNSYVKKVLNSFSDEHFNKHKIICSRRINSKNPESTASEIIISTKNQNS